MSHNVRVVSLDDHPIASPSSQALEVSISGMAFLLVNIYHHIVNSHLALGHILCSPLDTILPTYVVGDFNTHLLRSKGLKDATCVGWFGDDWDCLVGYPPKAMIT